MNGTELFDEKLAEWKRKGDSEKCKVLEGLNKRVLKSQLAKILKEDKSVYSDLFLPKWMTWELLRSWAAKFESQKIPTCVLCGNSGSGKQFNGKLLCNQCINEIKSSE